jgi:UDP-N-acetylglucosamine 2-epimerase (non-hydrolysing)
MVVVVGTRPEIIKMGPAVKGFEKRGVEFVFIHSGQYYDYEMSQVFMEKLGLSRPHESFKLENNNPASQMGEMLIKLERVLGKY